MLIGRRNKEVGNNIIDSSDMYEKSDMYIQLFMTCIMKGIA